MEMDFIYILDCLPTDLYPLILNHDRDDDADVVDFAAVIVLVRIEFLDLLGKRPVSHRVHADGFGLPDHIDGQERLQRRLFAIADPALQRQAVDLFAHLDLFLHARAPRVEARHLPAHDLEQLARAQVVPDAVGGEDEHVAVADLVARVVGIGGGVAQLLPAEDAREREDLGRDYGELVGGVEGVGLGVGEVVDGVEAEVNETRVAEAVRYV